MKQFGAAHCCWADIPRSTRAILGAQRLFNLEPVWSPQKLARRAAAAAN